MRKVYASIALICSIISASMLLHHAHADIQGQPFIPEIDARFNALEQGNHLKTACLPAGSCDGHWVKQIAQFTYDKAVQGGATTTGTALGVSLPANAIITRSYIYSITQPTTSASGTLAFKCQNASDILATTAAASFGAAGASIDGASTGTVGNFKYTTAACNIQYVIATGALTAGKVTGYVEYVVHK